MKIAITCPHAADEIVEAQFSSDRSFVNVAKDGNRYGGPLLLADEDFDESDPLLKEIMQLIDGLPDDVELAFKLVAPSGCACTLHARDYPWWPHTSAERNALRRMLDDAEAFLLTHFPEASFDQWSYDPELDEWEHLDK